MDLGLYGCRWFPLWGPLCRFRTWLSTQSISVVPDSWSFRLEGCRPCGCHSWLSRWFLYILCLHESRRVPRVGLVSFIPLYRRSFVDAGKYAVLLGAINGSIEAAYVVFKVHHVNVEILRVISSLRLHNISIREISIARIIKCFCTILFFYILQYNFFIIPNNCFAKWFIHICFKIINAFEKGKKWHLENRPASRGVEILQRPYFSLWAVL